MPESEWQADVTKLDCGGYVIRYKPGYFSPDDPERPLTVEFEVYKILFLNDNKVMMERIGSVSPINDPTERLEDAQCFLRGHIKWDGCSNWEFVNDGCMIHFCGPEGHREVAAAFEKMYKIAKDLTGSCEWE